MRKFYPRTLHTLLSIYLDETIEDYTTSIEDQEKSQQFLVNHGFLKEEKGDLILTPKGKKLIFHKLSDGISFKNILKMSTNAKTALVKEVLKSDPQIAESLVP